MLGVEIVGAIRGRPERRVWKATGVSTDSRTLRPGEIFFALRGVRCDGHDFVGEALERGAEAAVVDRAVDVPARFPGRVVRVPDTLSALGDAARAYRRRWGGTVVAITGSNGKTTTREMMYEALSEQVSCKRSPLSFNTDVGVPLTLFTAERRDSVMIVEMGTNAPGEIMELAEIAEPNLGVITNVGETHLEGLGSVEGVAWEKGCLLEALGREGTAFLNADDLWFADLASRHEGEVVLFGMGEGAEFRAHEVKREGGAYRFVIPGGVRVRLRVPGRHNVSNALAALAVAAHLDVDMKRAARALDGFRLPELRYEVEKIRGVTVVSDCYNANPVSMRAALKTLCETFPLRRRAAVLGEMLELGGESERLHAGVGAEAAACELNALWAVGTHAASLARSARDNGMDGWIAHAEDLEGISEEVRDYLRPGDVLLVKGSRGMRMERLVEEIRAAG